MRSRRKRASMAPRPSLFLPCRRIPPMDFLVQNTLTTIAIAVAMFALIAFGRRTGRRRLAADPTHARSGLAVIDASIFALLGLVIAFTFNGAGERLSLRRAHVGDELFVIENATASSTPPGRGAAGDACTVPPLPRRSHCRLRRRARPGARHRRDEGGRRHAA
jgi:hypothetical protein